MAGAEIGMEPGTHLDVEDLRQTLVSRISLGLLAIGFFATWLVPPDAGLLRGRFLIFMTLLLEGILAYGWRKRNRHLAQAILLMGPTLSLAGALYIVGGPLVPYYAIPIVLANSALSPQVGLVAAFLNSALLLGLHPLDATLLNALFLLWLAAGIESFSTRGLYTALDWASNSERRAISLLGQLRDRQGQLNRTLAALTEASRRLERTNRELDVALREAEEARQAKQRFVANISHELRTPLNIIVGYAEMLCTSPESYGEFSWPPALRSDLLSIRRNADHLLKMIDDVLDLAQIEAARMPILPEPTNLSELIRDTLETAGSLVLRAGLELRVALAPDLPSLNLDRTRIRQVLLNLIGNAVRHTSTGFIEVGAYLGNGDVVVYVRDSGEGIPAAKLETIFLEFEQIEASRRGRHGAAGLGLPISRHLIRLHGGRIWADSMPGQGSTFSFSLPCLTRHAATGVADLKRTQRSGPERVADARAVVLLCRDGQAMRLFERHLEALKVLPAESVGEAADWVRAQHPDAILVAADSQDALAAALADAQTLRDAVAPLDLPILVCGVPTERHAGLALGVNEFLIKPVTRAELATAVRRVCRRPGRILVVDDQPEMLGLLERMVGQVWLGAEVVAAASGEEALVRLSPEPDVILLDMLMPGLSGLEVLAALRSKPETAAIPVVAITARGPAETLTAAEKGEIRIIKNGHFTAGQLMRLLELLTKSLPPHYAAGAKGGPHTPAVALA
ncbi:MAG: ATP-binding protein [Anaerolineae bacterium]